MTCFKSQDCNKLLLLVELSEQITPGSFAFALDYLVDNELYLSSLDAQFKNDESGVGTCNPNPILKIALLPYSKGLISSRSFELPLLATSSSSPSAATANPDPLYDKTTTWQPKTIQRFGSTDFRFNANNTASGLHYQTYATTAAD